MTDTSEKPNYKKTINKPQTSFSMKANLVQNEPASQKRWAKMELYEKIREARKGRERYVFHDGPPYANGSIHLGHLLNKVLKDFVVRSKTLLGYDVPYVPGWDCHGLPIEHKVMQEQRDKLLAEGGRPDVMATRKACRKYAEKFVKHQSGQMQRLLTLADYDDPYLTMNPGFEASVLEVFAGLIERGLVYRGLKPVHWSIENQTALADAELEYYDREDTSVFVMFELTREAEQSGATHLMIWTTTPWTLPANLAVAVSERAEYGVYDIAGKQVVIAVDLAEKVLKQEQVEMAEPKAILKGSDLVGWTYQHPFIDRTGSVVAADYVTLEDGTGMVHTAPGHGVEDYQTGLREGLDIYCPVQSDGTFDTSVPEWLQGKTVWDANDLVCQRLNESGHMFHEQKFMHSYPHDWRGKTPVIFRATEQWFVDVNRPFVLGESPEASLKQRALDVTENDVNFLPGWGRNRMRGMLETRPDWCLSRQRAWGLPIPAFYPEDNGLEPLLTPASVLAVAKILAEKGSDAWFYMDSAQLLEHYKPGDDPHAPDWFGTVEVSTLKKSGDIFDVWFESGSSWHACMERRGLAWPRESGYIAERPVTDLYLEGSDQHRGWFQLSLLPCLGVTGQSPFKTVLTHGFMVDKDGRKMSKSLGNTLEVEELLKEFGADVCRWWVSSLNTDNDIKVDHDFFKVAGDEYRKIRNTIRFMLSNLGDFSVTEHTYSFTAEDSHSLDAWLLDALKQLSHQIVEAYEQLRFRKVHDLLFNFCNDTLSAVYLAAMKDRLYCDAVDSPRRRRTQTALRMATERLCLLLSPMMPHTADEAWRVLHGEDACVHLETLEAHPLPTFEAAEAWPKVIQQRDDWLAIMESDRQKQDIDNPLDLGLVVNDADGTLAKFDQVDLADLVGISQFEIDNASDGIRVKDLRDLARCERSWKRDGTVKLRDDGGMLSQRDAAALGLS